MASPLISYCGLYCGACSFQVAYETNDKIHLLSMPSIYDKYKSEPPENCPGCRLENKCGDCKLRDCAISKKVDHCSQCLEYPCTLINAFGNDTNPHHNDVFRNFKELKELGETAWLEAMEKKYNCPKCHDRFSWYYHKCKCK